MQIKERVRQIRDKLPSLRSQQRVMLWLFPVLLIIPNVLLGFTEHTSVLSKLSNVVLPFGVFIFLVSLSRNVGRTLLLMLPLMMYAAFQIVLLYLYGESIIATDMLLSVVTSNPGEAKELLGNLLAAIIVIFALYLPPVIWATVAILKKARLESRELALLRNTGKVLICTGLALLAVCYAAVPGYSITRELFPLNVMRNTVEAVHRTYLTTQYPETSEHFTYHAASTRPEGQKEVYVLVIGETSRADNWQLLGYERETNPLLSGRDDLVCFPRVLTESNTTHKTVPLLLSYLEADNYGDSIYQTKSVISAFNEAGYSTAFFSTQRHNHSFIDYFSEEADVTRFLVEEGCPQEDFQLASALRDYIGKATSDKLFVVLHSYGSHFNYRDRYPSEYSHFKPDDYMTASAGTRAQLVNAYDNSIRCTDRLLDDIIGQLDSLDCVSAMIYLSDHGEDIFDDERERFLHSSPTPTYYQLHVPLVVWMSPEMRRSYPSLYGNAAANSPKNVASTRAVFHSLLDMAGISTDYYRATESLFSDDYTEPGRWFINDYNEAVPLQESGLKNADLKMLRARGISY